MSKMIGKTYESKNFGLALVTALDGDRADILFLNTGNTENVHRVALYNGMFSDHVEKRRIKEEKEANAKARIEARLLSKTTHGVGFIGIGPHKTTSRIGTAWRSMMRRCYSANWHVRYPSYIGTTVCERWHNFQNFAEDFPKLENYDLWLEGGYELDKDSRILGNKTYSPEACSLITKADNYAEAITRMHREGRAKVRTAVKVYRLRNPEGEEVEVDNLKSFCAEQNLTYTTMVGLANGRKGVRSHRGYTGLH